jgi:3-oxoacyl-[acyl-carrier-protein] synthase-1
VVYFIADNIISSLGFTTLENFDAMQKGLTGIGIVENADMYREPFPASLVDTERLKHLFGQLAKTDNYTRAEMLSMLSIYDALQRTTIDPVNDRTAFLFSTTKGNIDLLEPDYPEKYEEERVLLWRMAEVISAAFGNKNRPYVISNACVSGVLAINIAAGMIESGKYDHVIVNGVDIASRFVVSGFMSFLSLSPGPCKPFDKNRDGLSLGEGAGTIILSREDNGSGLVYAGGSSANDANHISGPSRTGEGSFTAIKKAFVEAGINGDVIDHISAHGTATVYNDEMESISISRHGMNEVPVNSFKGYWGHTLGTAGIIETAALLKEMEHNLLLRSAGYEEHGVSESINVIRQEEKKELKTCLKMASGFGGSNAALVIRKVK